MMLQREVELPARLHQRASFYLALASFLLSLSIIVDAALWARPTVAVERAVTARRLHLRPPCRARADAYHRLMRDIAETEAEVARLERERALADAQRALADAQRALADAQRELAGKKRALDEPVDRNRSHMHEQLTQQLEHPWAGDDDLDAGGRYSNIISDPTDLPQRPGRR